MTAISRNPANRDLLQSTKYKFVLARTPAITYFCQTANLPGVSLSEIVRSTPFIDLFVPGEKMQHDTLNITFLLDEDLIGWEQLYEWIRGTTFPQSFEQYAAMAKEVNASPLRAGAKLPPPYSDASLTLFTNKNNENIRIQFKDVFPTSIGSVQFSALDSAENILTCDATFRFSYYNLARV
jgi:hypothetical protein